MKRFSFVGLIFLFFAAHCRSFPLDPEPLIVHEHEDSKDKIADVLASTTDAVDIQATTPGNEVENTLTVPETIITYREPTGLVQDNSKPNDFF